MIKQKVPLQGQAEYCGIHRYAIDVQYAPRAAGSDPETTLGNYRKALSKAFEQGKGDLLFLSGGGQNGAFGAGFLSGWHVRDGGLPKFRVVTGVSTGALQSTGVFIGRPDITLAGYTIDKESQILQPFISASDLESGIPITAAVTTLTRGAFADLVPLKSHLDALYTPDIMLEVAARADTGAKLFAGATDVDAGKAIAFDLTELATRYRKAEEQDDKDRIKSCYLDALIASSIVPPGAKPRFIDNRMYIDGGVKFAIFAEDIGALINDPPPLPPPPPPTIGPGPGPQPDPPPVSQPDSGLDKVYIVLNTTGRLDQKCGKRNPEDCDSPPNQPMPLPGQHADWSVPGLAVRTLSILINQVETLSIDRAVSLEREGFDKPYLVRIEEGPLAEFRTSLENAPQYGALTCDQWSEIDSLADPAPIEFHPNYMRCLIKFGYALGKGTAWDDRPPEED
jgi:hypothetical protein